MSVESPRLASDSHPPTGPKTAYSTPDVARNALKSREARIPTFTSGQTLTLPFMSISGEGRMGQEIAGYSAEYSSCTGMLCYGFGETKDAAWREVRSQIMGATPSMQRMILPRVKLRALGADEASEVCEMLATPW